MTTAKQKNKLEIFNRLNYVPSEEQSAFHMDDHRFKLVAGGERAGKSFSSAMELAGQFYEGDLYWLVGSEYGLTRPEFEYLVEAFQKLGAYEFSTKEVNPGHILLKGGVKIETKSASDPRKLGMSPPDGILACEAAQLDIGTINRLRGRIAEKRGWLVMSGTFEGSLGWYPELWTRWQSENPEEGRSYSIPTWSNLAVYPGGRNDPEILALEQYHSRDFFNERYGAIPCPPSGRVFDDFQSATHVRGLKDAGYENTTSLWCDNAHRTITFDPEGDVYLWTDPGYDGACAVELALIKGDTVYIFDEIYEKGLVTSQIIDICKSRPWWNRVSVGVADVAALQHQSQPAVAETWQTLARLHMRTNKVPILEGIERLKTFLKPDPVNMKPKIYIDPQCKGLISELGGCPNPISGQTEVYQWKTAHDGTVVGKTPEDKNNHAVKAVIYGLVDKFGYARGQVRERQVLHF